MKITVIVTTYRREVCLTRCLSSLAAQRRRPEEVVVVGQGDDGAPRRLVAAWTRRAGAGWRYVHIPVPDMMAAFNAGLAAARGDVVAFIDDDAAADRHWLAALERWYRDPAVGGVGGPNVDYFDGQPLFVRTREVGRLTWYGRCVAHHGGFTPGPRHVHFLRGCNMSFRRDLVPPFPQALRPYWSANEIYVCGAVRRRGYRLIYDPGVIVNHYPEPAWRLDRAAVLGFDSEGAWRRAEFRNDAHNSAFALLAHLPWYQKPVVVAYDFLVGNRRAPGLARALALAAEGHGAEGWAKLGPALAGKCAGVASFVKEQAAKARARRVARRPALR
jgi:glycosyltransferase involved in cell wall biosynthesis